MSITRHTAMFRLLCPNACRRESNPQAITRERGRWGHHAASARRQPFGAPAFHSEQGLSVFAPVFVRSEASLRCLGATGDRVGAGDLCRVAGWPVEVDRDLTEEVLMAGRSLREVRGAVCALLCGVFVLVLAAPAGAATNNIFTVAGALAASRARGGGRP